MNFLDNLNIQETSKAPMSIMEMEKMGESFSRKEEEKTEGEQSNTEELQQKEIPGGLMPITDLMGSKDLEEEVEKKNKEKATSTSKNFLDIIKKLQEKTGELEDFNEEEFSGEEDAFVELIENLTYKNAESLLENYIKENLPSEYQKFVELTDAGVPEDQAAEVAQGIKTISSLTNEQLEESEDLSKKTYTQYLKLTSSWNDAKIKKEVDRLSELGTISEDAKEILPELVSIITNRENYYKEEAKKQEVQKKLTAENDAKQLKEYLDVTDEIAGIKLNKKMKENWIKQYTPVKTSTGQLVSPLAAKRQNNPQEFDALVNFFDSIGLFKYDGRTKKFTPDLSVLKGLGTKEAIKSLEQAVQSDKAKSQTRGGFNPEANDTTKDELIERFTKVAEAEAQKRKLNNQYNY